MMNGRNGSNGYGGNGHRGIDGVAGGYGTRDTSRGRLISYLASLGLAGDDLAKVRRRLQARPSKDRGEIIVAQEHTIGPVNHRRRKSPPETQTIGLYLAEEHQNLREVYQSFFDAHPAFRLLGSATEDSSYSLLDAAIAFKPDVMLVGTNALRPALPKKLSALRNAASKVALVLLFSSYDDEGIIALRDIPVDYPSGCAYLLKHTVHTTDQLIPVIHAVLQGRFMVDPLVMDELIKAAGRAFVD